MPEPLCRVSIQLLAQNANIAPPKPLSLEKPVIPSVTVAKIAIKSNWRCTKNTLMKFPPMRK